MPLRKNEKQRVIIVLNEFENRRKDYLQSRRVQESEFSPVKCRDGVQPSHFPFSVRNTKAYGDLKRTNPGKFPCIISIRSAVALAKAWPWHENTRGSLLGTRMGIEYRPTFALWTLDNKYSSVFVHIVYGFILSKCSGRQFFHPIHKTSRFLWYSFILYRSKGYFWEILLWLRLNNRRFL